MNKGIYMNFHRVEGLGVELIRC